MPIVYEILADEARLPYYGSTTTTLERRRRLHGTNYTRWKEGKARHCAAHDLFDAVGFHACKFRVIEELPEDCSNEQLLWRERYWIENCPCVNRNRPIITDDEQKEIIIEGSKAYYAEHRDDVLRRTNKYYHENREKYREYERRRQERKKATQTPSADPPIV